jgi:secreted PhoX family phosphatase
MVREVTGRPLAEPDTAGNTCDPAGIANPDNLTFLPGYGLLMIAEDTKRHPNAVLWAYDVRQRTLVPVARAPFGGEMTGIHWIPDLHGHGYLTLAVQHPYGELPKGTPIPPGITDADKRAFTGYIGPFPSLKR